MIIIDRSRLEAAMECPRKYYWHYLHGGSGIERKSVSVPLLTGSLIHSPLAAVLLRYRQGLDLELQHIVDDAKQEYVKVVSDRGLLLDYFDGSDAQLGQVESSPIAWQVNEQIALLEALVKGWVRVRLPRLLEEYEIIDVEQEQAITLGRDIVMLTRRDALLRRRQTGEYFVLNFKTTSNPDQTWREQWRYDQQTISEFVAADASVRDKVGSAAGGGRSAHLDSAVKALDGGTPSVIASPSAMPTELAGGQGSDHVVRGVLIEGLVKGQRKLKWPEDVEPAQWRHNSPLLYHYATAANPPMPRSYYADAYRTCTEPHPWRWVKGGHCPGGKKHKIGDEYQRDMVSQTCGIDSWLDWLSENDQQTLEAQFIALPAIIRSDYEIERWKRQTIGQANDLDGRRAELEIEQDGGEATLDNCFPMATGGGNCLRPSRCPFLDLCFGVADPDDREAFVARVPNHPAETKLVTIKV
jgi:hypothetical protein